MDMVRSVTNALAAALLSSSVFLPPASAAGPAGAGQQEIVPRTKDAALAPRLVSETLRGVVESIDEGSDTMRIRLSRETIEQLRVQDGLIFNAVRYGDQVEVTVQTIAGTKTVVGVVKE
jgi:hypothetical protein